MSTVPTTRREPQSVDFPDLSGVVSQALSLRSRSYITATARRYNLTIVTGNDTHFRRPGLKVFNPFKELRPQL